jgi:iron(III) transport system permease protein
MVRAVSLERLLGVLRDSRFLMLENPFTPQSETLRALLVAAAIALAGSGLDRARRLRGLLVGLAVGLALGVALFGRGALASSLLVAGMVAPLSTLLGLAFAILEQRTRLRFLRPVLGGLALLPLITPPFVLAFALILMFGRNGFVSAHLLGLDSNFLFGPVGLITAQVLAFAPVAFLVLRGSVQGLNASLEEAAWSLGSSRWRVFRTVTLPLLRPGLANALLLAVIESLSDFGNPLILGGDRNYLATGSSSPSPGATTRWRPLSTGWCCWRWCCWSSGCSTAGWARPPS